MWLRDNIPYAGDGCEAGGEWYECDGNGYMGCCVVNACDYSSGCPPGLDHTPTGTTSTSISETSTMSQTVTVDVSASYTSSTSGVVVPSATSSVKTPTQTTFSSSPPSTSSTPITSSTIPPATTPFTLTSSNANSAPSISPAWSFASASATPTSNPSSKSSQPTAGIVAGSVGGGIVLSIVVALFACYFSRRRNRKQKYIAPSVNPLYDENGFDAPTQAKNTDEKFNSGWYRRFTGPSKSSSLSDSLQHTPDPNAYTKSPEMPFQLQNGSIPEDDIPQLDSTPIFPQVELDNSTRSELDGTSPVTAINTPFIVSPFTAHSSPNLQGPVSPELYEMGAGVGPDFPHATSQNSGMQANLNRQAARKNNQHVMSWATYNSSRSDVDQQHGLGILSARQEINGVMNRGAREESMTASQS